MVIRDLGKYRMTDNYLIQLIHSNKQSTLFTGTETDLYAAYFTKRQFRHITYSLQWLDSIHERFSLGRYYRLNSNQCLMA